MWFSYLQHTAAFFFHPACVLKEPSTGKHQVEKLELALRAWGLGIATLAEHTAHAEKREYLEGVFNLEEVFMHDALLWHIVLPYMRGKSIPVAIPNLTCLPTRVTAFDASWNKIGAITTKILNLY